jgi:hypothetical protein
MLSVLLGRFMKDFFDQFFSYLKPLIENTKYRFNNPLGYAFIFSWIVVNWKAVYYFLFSDEKAADKISYLHKMYITDASVSYWWIVFLPALLAMSYVILAPVISNIATGLWSVIDKSCTTWRLKYVEKLSILSEVDKANMYLAINKLRSAHQLEVETLRREIDGYQDIILIEKEKESDKDKNSELHIELQKFKTIIENQSKEIEEQQRLIQSEEKKFKKLSLAKSREYEAATDTNDLSSHDENKNRTLEQKDKLLESFTSESNPSNNVDSQSNNNDSVEKFANTNIRRYIVLNDWLDSNLYDISNSKHNGKYKIEAVRYLNLFISNSICNVNISSSNDSESNAKRQVIRDFVSAGIIDFVQDNEYQLSPRSESQLNALIKNGSELINATINDYVKKLTVLEQLLSEKYNRNALGEWFTHSRANHGSIADIVLSSFSSNETYKDSVQELGVLVIKSVLKTGEDGSYLSENIPLNALERDIVLKMQNHFMAIGYLISLDRNTWMLSLKILESILDFISDYNNSSDDHESVMIKEIKINEATSSNKVLLLRLSNSTKTSLIEDIIFEQLVKKLPINSQHTNIELYKKVFLRMVGASISGNGYTLSSKYSEEDIISLNKFFSELSKNKVCFKEDGLYYLSKEIAGKVTSIISKELDS